MTTFSKKPAFTLIETIVVLAILVVVLLALFNLFQSYNKIYQTQQGLVRTSNSAGSLMNELQSSILQSTHVLSSHNFSGTTYSSNSNTLVLELPSIDASGNIVSSKYDYAVFYITGSKSYRLVQSDPASSRPAILKQLSDSINTITYTYNNADFTQVNKVDVDLRTLIQTSSQAIQNHLHQQIRLRNIQ